MNQQILLYGVRQYSRTDLQLKKIKFTHVFQEKKIGSFDLRIFAGFSNIAVKDVFLINVTICRK